MVSNNNSPLNDVSSSMVPIVVVGGTCKLEMQLFSNSCRFVASGSLLSSARPLEMCSRQLSYGWLPVWELSTQTFKLVTVVDVIVKSARPQQVSSSSQPRVDEINDDIITSNYHRARSEIDAVIWNDKSGCCFFNVVILSDIT